MDKIIASILIIIAASGCTSINRSYLDSSMKVTIDSPMRAKIDVDMNNKLVGYASGGYFLHFFMTSGDNRYADNVTFNHDRSGLFSSWSKVNAVKAAATYNALRTSNADIIVNPQYVIEENHWNPFYKLIKVKVTGHPGKISAIKNK